MMKNIKIYALTCLLVIASYVSFSQTTDGFLIEGSIKGLNKGAVLLKRANDDRTTTVIDSVIYKAGAFELKGKLHYPELLTITVMPGNWSVPVFVENAKIILRGDTMGAQHYDYSRYGMGRGATLKNVKVTGSVSNDQYNLYEHDPQLIKYNGIAHGLEKIYNAEKDPGKKEGLRKKLVANGKLTSEWQLKWINDFVAKNPEATAGAYIFNNYYIANEEMPLKELEALLDKFKGDALGSVYYKKLMADLAGRKALLPGAIAPDFTLLQRDSTALTLSSTRGKYIMIDFWASWCHPCREAIPHWKQVYKKYHDKGFDIISVSDDDKWANWTKAMDAEQMPWMQVIDEFPVKFTPARVGTLYGTRYIPFYVLLDKDGKILVYSGEEKDIVTKLSALLD